MQVTDCYGQKISLAEKMHVYPNHAFLLLLQ